MDTSINCVFTLALSQKQKQGMSMRNAYCLSNGHNAVSVFVAKPRRASIHGIISGVTLFMKAISIHCKARLGSDALNTRRINTELIEVSLCVES